MVYKQKRLMFTALIGLVVFAGLVLPEPAHAASTWYVAPGGNDANACSSVASPCANIQAPLNKAGFTAGDTIKIAVGTYTGTDLDIVLLEKNATLSGGWSSSFATQTGTSNLDGEKARRGVRVSTGVTATIDRLAIQNGVNTTFEGGGAISVNQAILYLSNSTLMHNVSHQNGGAVANQSGTVVVTNSTISDNISDFSGGAIYNGSGTVIVTDSTLRGNRATGIGGGIGSYQGMVTVNHSNITENVTGTAGGSGGGGGGIGADGGATIVINNSAVTRNQLLASQDGGGVLTLGTLNINNSTISGNRGATNGGGIAILYGTGDLYSVTVSDNLASGNGGGVYASNGTATLHNSLVSRNTAHTMGADCNGTISSSGYNLVGSTADCTFPPGTGDVTNTDPKLGVLAGAPGYVPLLAGSAAINAGNPSGCVGSSGPLPTDERGTARVGRCDIGAYEYTIAGAAASIAALSGSGQHTVPLHSFSAPLRVIVLDGIGTPVGNATVTFTAPNSGASATFAATGTNSSSVNTDASGVATTSVLTANATLGSYSVSAVVGGVANSASFTLANLEWYVKPGGSDANDCATPTSACATINGVFTKTQFQGGDPIKVATGTFIGIGNEVVLLSKNAEISGGWDGAFVNENGITILDGQGVRRGITVNGGVTASLGRFTIQNGFANQDDSGGGLLNKGTLAVYDSTIKASRSKGGGGGIVNTGTLTLRRVLVEGNVAEDSAGYIVSGGGISTGGKMTLSDSLVVNNTASFGGGISAVGILILNNSTVADNIALQKDLGGSGITTGNATVRLYSSTVSGNHGGPGIYRMGGTIMLRNTIIARNDSDCGGGIGSLGHNVIENTKGCDFTPTEGDVIDESAQISPLQNNGGNTRTNAIARLSPAVDNGDPAGCKDDQGQILDFDQRGAARRDGDGDSVVRCDSGAFEFDPVVCANLTPEAPVLNKPKPDGALRKPKASFAWSGQFCPDEYRLIVKKGSSNGKTILSESVKKLQYNGLQLELGKKYAWQAAACNSGVCTTSGWQEFSVRKIKTGKWSGTTDQGLPLQVNVGGKPLQWDTFVVQVQFPTCTVELSAKGPANIKKGRFKVGGSIGGGSLLYNGEFKDPSHLKGTYNADDVTLDGCGTLTRNGNWSATWSGIATSKDDVVHTYSADKPWNTEVVKR